MEVITHPEFDKIPNIKYGFFTRNGGVSKEVFSSLNVKYGTGDSLENVKQNQKIIERFFDLEESNHLIRPFQIHSNKTIIVKDSKDLDKFKIEDYDKTAQGDAIVTNLKNVLIGVSTADCVPVLFADEINKIIGVSHAGWRGARYGILESTINAMVSLGADLENIKALIGPCIREKSYEVDDKFLQEFLKEDEENRVFFIELKNRDQYIFHIAEYIKTKLSKNGIKYIYDVKLDTYSDEQRFFSYRRGCDQGECKRYGAQFSGIMLK